ncbi:MAG: hypothetical protein AAB453_00115 [Patescibacteria group bacterium]
MSTELLINKIECRVMRRIYLLWFCRYSLFFRATVLGVFAWGLSYYLSPSALVTNYGSDATFTSVYNRTLSAFWETEMAVKTLLPLFAFIAVWLLAGSLMRSYKVIRQRIFPRQLTRTSLSVPADQFPLSV